LRFSLGFLDDILILGEKECLHCKVDDMTKTARTVIYRAPFRDSLSNGPAEGVNGSVVVAGYEPQPVSDAIRLQCLDHMFGDLLATGAGFELRKGNESLVQL
jgi:hypothetical protein